jgi:hypothetical protein
LPIWAAAILPFHYAFRSELREEILGVKSDRLLGSRIDVAIGMLVFLEL